MVSIVIPAYNEEKMIQKCLGSLVAQKTQQAFEVIVVDNNSTDKTYEIVQRYKDKLNVSVIKETTKGRGAARSTGFKHAKGNIILSTDADTILPSNWIEKMTHAFKNPQVAAITGTCKINDCSRFINFIFNIFQPFSMIFYRIVFGYFWLSGFNSGIRKETYEKSGGFNRKLNALEDVEIAKKIKPFGKIKFIYTTPVTFSGRRFKKGFIKGLLSYITIYSMYQLDKKRNIMLSDMR